MNISVELKNFLEEKYLYYCRPEFIETDPIQIPHLFTQENDIEISAFLTAIISWGNRKTIIKNAHKLMKLMDYSPFDFILNAGESEYKFLSDFYHRTFNGIDTVFFIKSLQNIYLNYGGLKNIFYKGYFSGGIEKSIENFRGVFFSLNHELRTEKHIPDITKNASEKRLNMFLRWMARKDKQGIDFGIWDKILAKELYIPLDVHTGNVARKLGLLSRKQNDWIAVKELTGVLRQFDPDDPVKYDFALFGLGIFEKF